MWTLLDLRGGATHLKKKKEKRFSSFRKIRLQGERFCSESPLTFYFYLLREKSSKNKTPNDSSQEEMVYKT